MVDKIKPTGINNYAETGKALVASTKPESSATSIFSKISKSKLVKGGLLGAGLLGGAAVMIFFAPKISRYFDKKKAEKEETAAKTEIEKFVKTHIGEGKDNCKYLAQSLIRAHEEYRSDIYKDATGKYTTGYGHLITKQTGDIEANLEKDLETAKQHTKIQNISTKIEKGKPNTNQILMLFYSDMSAHEKNAISLAGGKEKWDKIPAAKQAAILSLCFNVGKGKIEKKKDGTPTNFITNFKNGDWEKAQDELDFYSAGGTTLSGLIKRRYVEKLLINDGKLTETSKKQLTTAYNKYIEQMGLLNKAVKGFPAKKSSFEEVEKILLDDKNSTLKQNYSTLLGWE
ncbi:MAG: hypothetical protein PHX18_02470 [Candidatus Gastranaerophilales bacterium]|nr:hypothetical protein [Candidatus Gastranaerophilales bacterium]